jgi:hypothetical protein
VEFFADRNGNGALDVGIDDLLGIDASGVDGWTLNMPTSAWAPGPHTLLARAIDDLGLASATKRFTLKLVV